MGYGNSELLMKMLVICILLESENVRNFHYEIKQTPKTG